MNKSDYIQQLKDDITSIESHTNEYNYLLKQFDLDWDSLPAKTRNQIEDLAKLQLQSNLVHVDETFVRQWVTQQKRLVAEHEIAIDSLTYTIKRLEKQIADLSHSNSNLERYLEETGNNRLSDYELQLKRDKLKDQMKKTEAKLATYKNKKVVDLLTVIDTVDRLKSQSK